jgi:hypothetical protein
VKAVVDVVASNDIPLRLPMGSDAWGLMKVEVEGMSMELDKWKTTSESSLGGKQMESVEFLKKWEYKDGKSTDGDLWCHSQAGFVVRLS